MDQQSQRKPRLTLLVGFIASGKSTYCRQRAKEGAIIINDDAITNALHAGQYQLYDKRLKPLYKIIETTILQIGLSIGRDVVVDRPNFLRITRQRYITIAKSLDMPTTILVFPIDSPEEHARRRAASDPRGYDYEWWLKVCKSHFSQFQQPEEWEADEIIRL